MKNQETLEPNGLPWVKTCITPADWDDNYTSQTMSLGADYSWVSFTFDYAGTVRLVPSANLADGWETSQGIRWEFIGATESWNNLDYYYASVDASSVPATYFPMWETTHEFEIDEPGTLWITKYDYFTENEAICAYFRKALLDEDDEK